MRSKGKRESVEQVIKELPPLWMDECQSTYLKGYFKLLPRAKVIALNELEDNPEANELDWVIP